MAYDWETFEKSYSWRTVTISMMCTSTTSRQAFGDRYWILVVVIVASIDFHGPVLFIFIRLLRQACEVHTLGEAPQKRTDHSVLLPSFFWFEFLTTATLKLMQVTCCFRRIGKSSVTVGCFSQWIAPGVWRLWWPQQANYSESILNTRLAPFVLSVGMHDAACLIHCSRHSSSEFDLATQVQWPAWVAPSWP